VTLLLVPLMAMVPADAGGTSEASTMAAGRVETKKRMDFTSVCGARAPHWHAWDWRNAELRE
jgi:hypothetical protein